MSAHERTKYKCRDLIGQLEYGLEAMIGWESHVRSHAGTFGLPRAFYYESTGAYML